MVRLTPRHTFATWELHKFQFQYGAIKTLDKNNTNQFYLLFQFHYGAIKTLLFESIQFEYHAISIPLWCD